MATANMCNIIVEIKERDKKKSWINAYVCLCVCVFMHGS